MAIAKQGILDWPGNDERMMSHSNFKVIFSERLLVVVIGLWF